jgi:hypothetical protein
MSMCYYCPVCSQRFEHEEVEEHGTTQYCSNCCQKVNLITEHEYQEENEGGYDE